MKPTVFDFIKDHLYIILGVVCIVIIGLVYILVRLQPDRSILPQDIIYATSENDSLYVPAHTPIEIIEEEAEEPTLIMVHIIGEVNNPGVIELPYGSRVYHALQLAGGGTIYANLAGINLVAVLRDAMQIRIPAFGEEGEYFEELFVYEGTQTTTQATTQNASGLVNINTANIIELQTLPNIGPVLAQRIIDFRESNGMFASTNDLIRVTGIGDRILDGLLPLVIV